MKTSALASNVDRVFIDDEGRWAHVVNQFESWDGSLVVVFRYIGCERITAVTLDCAYDFDWWAKTQAWKPVGRICRPLSEKGWNFS